MPKNTIDDIKKNLKAKVERQRDLLLKYLEDDNTDFTGLHTTQGIDVDSFYSGFYDINREMDKLMQALYQDLLDCLPDKMETNPVFTTYSDGHNKAVEQIEAKLKQYFGKE